MRLASVSDPNFKTIWADESEKEQLITLLKSTVRRHKTFNLNPVSDIIFNLLHYLKRNNGGDVSTKKKTWFLDGYKTKRESLEADEVESYLNHGSTKLSSLQRFPTIKKIFMEYNSALPSSAACERVFSTAGLIFTAKRTRLSDLNFEILGTFKNYGHWEEIRAETSWGYKLAIHVLFYFLLKFKKLVWYNRLNAMTVPTTTTPVSIIVAATQSNSTTLPIMTSRGEIAAPRMRAVGQGVMASNRDGQKTPEATMLREEKFQAILVGESHKLLTFRNLQSAAI
ncbi:Uncharacterized protein APZ42_028873 [Daphnia magna]|uniref:HAT C-terminal dimerisation domain-containing protein n=1 Tax=Daphnia magna TaxID=35525 RepID=A0A164Q3Z4_9CRUS|nr:Uncharacterized protein APZ42_028873 [Daphnia magna]